MKIIFSLISCLIFSNLQSQELKENNGLSFPKEEVNLSEKIEPLEVGKNVIFKGQILDKDSNLPIPFANLTLEKEEIYRVADENGHYELSVKKAIIEHATVAISSMGYESKTVLLKELNERIYLKSKFEELDAVVITNSLPPKTVLKKAIEKKKLNHPVEPFNFYRYAKILINKDDSNEVDLELITKDYDDGYLSPYVITQRVKQVKWNENKNTKKYKISAQFFSYRQNAIRYSNILHKQKYKNFKLSFVKSDLQEDDHLYIVAFETERNKWNYTNRPYPTVYSGKVYVDKKSFAIVKVVENWETTLREEEIAKHFKGFKSYKDIVETTIKEENICYYTNVLDTGKYYATRYFNRSYKETLDTENEKKNTITVLDSYLFDFETEDVEEIEFYEYNNKKENSLYRVGYNKSFWDAFYRRQISAKLD